MKNRVGRLFLGILVLSIITAACGGIGPPFPLNSWSTELTIEPVWFIDPAQSSIAIIVLDYTSLQLAAAYVKKQQTCSSNHPPVSEDELIQTASGMFNAVGKSWARRLVLGKDEAYHEQLAFDTRLSGDLAVLEIQPDDLGGVAIMHRCTGLVLFAGSIVRGGRGEQFHPANPVIPNSLKRNDELAATPRNIEVMIGPVVEFADENSGARAWEAIRNLNIVQEFVSAPSDVLIYLYPRTVGGFNPDKAEWVIVINRYPTNP